VLKVKLKVPFVLINPLSNLPVSLVTECATGSLFVHVIEVPLATVIVEGLNAIPSIKTSFAPALGPLEDFLQLFVRLKIAAISNILTINLLLGNVYSFIIDGIIKTNKVKLNLF
jgi:hypothetical protein